MKKALKIILITLLSLSVLAVLSITVAIAAVKSDPQYVNFDMARLNDINYTLNVTDYYGNSVDQAVYIDNYKQVSLNSLHDYTVMAFVNTEDKRFYSHDGLDYMRIGKAVLNNLTSHSFKEGASTISQQLIKNTHLDNKKTLKRKINEILLTGELESRFTKDKILEMYLNTIYFGRNAYGIESASNVYFDKSASELTVSESAILAGMIKAPNNYAPDKNAEKCRQRRDVVLSLMKEYGTIDEQQYNEALNEEIETTSNYRLQQTYMYGVVEQATKLLNMTPVQLLNSRLTIETYYKPEIQQSVKKAVDGYTGNDNVSALISENDHSGIVAFYGTGKDIYFTKRQAGSALKPLAVYAPALNERKITVATPVVDEKTNFGGYTPKNFNDKYYGTTNVQQSVVKSLNVPAVKILNSIGIQTAEKYLQKLGMSVDEEQNLSLALGNVTGGTMPIEVIQGYSTLARQGLKSNLSFIKCIRNADTVIYSHKNENTEVFSKASSFLTTDLLKNVVRQGTAKKLSVLPYEICAKTGTVGDKEGNTNALVCGYTSKFTFNVWLSGQLGNSVTGGGIPCEIAVNMLKDAYAEKISDFAIPDCVVKADIDSKLLHEKGELKLANPLLKEKDVATYYFDAKNCPEEYSMRNLEEQVELTVTAEEGKVTIEANQQQFRYRLYKTHKTNTTTVEFEREYIDTNVTEGEYTYYAEILFNGNAVGKTRKYTVTIPHKEETHPLWEFPEFDFTKLWYLWD